MPSDQHTPAAHPVLAHPEDSLRVLSVPAVPLCDIEDAPRVVAVLGRHEHAHLVLIGPLLGHVLLPDDGEEERACRRHDGDVGHAVVVCVALETLNHALEEGVVWDGAHGVVADARGERAAQPGWVLEHHVQTPGAAIVEIKVDAAVVVEDEVADGIGALDGEGVGVEGVEEPGVSRADEFAGEFVCPELEG
ncbi:hypothetical protein V491_02390 [Pseudogymnoascus sp. VKM F-3775]|nr:hypothetical protein V491_02390 [Pseudogymnoascus sp. VKM F-3775]